MTNPLIAEEVAKIIEENAKLQQANQEKEQTIKCIIEQMSRLHMELETYRRASGVELGY